MARFGRSATAAPSGDPFRDLAFVRGLAKPFVLVRRLDGMLEGVSRGSGRNAEEPKKQMGRGRVTIGTAETTAAGVAESTFVVVMEIA